MKTAPRYALLNKLFNLFLSLTFLSAQLAPAKLIAAEVLTNPAPLTTVPEISLEKAKEQQPTPAPQNAPTSLESLAAAPLAAATPQRVIEVRPGQDFRAALNSAQSGDKILIYAGTYRNPVNNNYQLTSPGKTDIEVEGIPDADGKRPVIEGYTWYLTDGMTLSHLEVKPPSDSPNAASPLILSNSHHVTIKNVKTTSIRGYGDFTTILDSEVTVTTAENVNDAVEIFGNDNQIQNTKLTGYGKILRLNGDRNMVSQNILRSIAPSKGVSCDYYVRGICYGGTVVDNVEPIVDINGANNSISQNTIVGYGSTNPGNSGARIYGAGNKIINTIIANMATAVDAHASVEIRYSLLQSQSSMTNIAAGPGLITGQNPFFVNLAAGDFRLQLNSPAISAGDPASGLDEFGTPREIGAFSYDRAPVVAQVEILPVVAKTFTTSDLTLAYLQSQGISKFTLAEIQALKPAGSGVSGNFQVLTAGSGSVAVSFSGEVQSFNCFVTQGISHCIVSGISSTSKTLWKAAGYSDVTVSSSKLVRSGMTPEGNLVLQAEHGSITVYKFGGGVKAYAQSVIFQGWTQVPGTHYATQKEISAAEEKLKLLDTSTGAIEVLTTNDLSSGYRISDTVYISPDYTVGGPVVIFALTRPFGSSDNQVNLVARRIGKPAQTASTVLILAKTQVPLGSASIKSDGTIVNEYSTPIATGGTDRREYRWSTAGSQVSFAGYGFYGEHIPALLNSDFEFRDITEFTSAGYRNTLEIINKTTGASTFLFDERTTLSPGIGFKGGYVSPDGKWVTYQMKTGIFIKSVENPTKMFSLLDIAGGTLNALGNLKAVRFPDADTLVVDTTTRTGIVVSTLSLPEQAVQTASNPNFYFVYEGSGPSARLVLYKKTGDQVTKQVLLANDPSLNPVNRVDVSPDGQTVIYAKRTAIYKDNGAFKHWEETIYVQSVSDPSRKLILTENVQALNSSSLVIEQLRFEGNILVIKSKKGTRRVNLTMLKLA